jgi:hypothetical protein
LAFLFLAESSFAGEISIAPVQPVEGSVLYHESVLPEASVTSEFELRSVMATLGSQEVPLRFVSTAQTWAAASPLNLSSLPSGTNEIVFTAVDVFGTSAEKRAKFVLDRLPVLRVLTPMDAIARPLVEIAADCEDDLGDCTILVRDFPENNVLFTGSNRVRGTVDLSQYEGSVREIRFFAFDERTLFVGDQRNIISLSNPRFQEVEQVPGRLLAHSRNALLFSVQDGTNVFLKLKDRTTETTQVVATNFAAFPAPALTETGVIYAAMKDGALHSIDFNRGEYLELGADYSFFIAEGRFAILGKYADMGLSALRDVVARTNAVIPVASSLLDVAENGTVVLHAEDKLYQFRNPRVRVIADPAPLNVGISPQTDGTNTVWFFVSGGAIGPDDPVGSIWAETPQGIVQLSSGLSSYTVFQRKNIFGAFPYLIANGWIAFTRPGAQGQHQVWIRSPEGVERQVTFFSQNSYLMALRQDGAVLTGLTSSSNPRESAPPEKIYFIDHGSPPQLLSGNLGTFSFEGEELHAFAGNTLFRLQTEGLPIGMSSARVEPGLFSFYVTGTAPASFEVESSTNLLQWSSISSSSVSNTFPQRLEFPIPPQRLDSKMRVYRLRTRPDE